MLQRNEIHAKGETQMVEVAGFLRRIFLLIFFSHRTEHASVNKITGSRKGWTEVGGVLRVGKWYAETKLENFARENDIPFEDDWVRYQGTRHIAYGFVTTRIYGRAPLVLSFRKDWLDGYVDQKSDEDVRLLIESFRTDDKERATAEIEAYLNVE